MKDKPKNKDIVSIIIISILVIAMLIGIVTIIKQGTQKEKQQEKLAYTELIQKIGNGEIERIELSENSNSAKIKIKNVEEEEKIQVPNRQAFIELIQDEIKERQLC